MEFTSNLPKDLENIIKIKFKNKHQKYADWAAKLRDCFDDGVGANAFDEKSKNTDQEP